MSAATPIYPGVVPEPGVNNVWYRYSGADTVFIFVHGIFSDSRGCWMYQPSRNQSKSGNLAEIYWPRLIAEDPHFTNVDIYLAGFYTAPDANSYGLQDSAHAVYERLSVPYEPANKPLIACKNLVFIGHSTGGIVIRYLLTRNYPELKDKGIGVVLIASPSIGSVYASRLKWLIGAYHNDLGKTLVPGNVLSRDLDDRFSDMINDKSRHIPRLMGAEACEHQIIFRQNFLGRLERWFPPLVRSRIVDPESAGRYFRPVELIPETDHFSIVKPPTANHPSHDFIRRFWYRFSQTMIGATAAAQATPPIPALGPPLPAEQLVGRAALIAQAKREILDGSHCIAISGPAGVGKTLLASTLANDPEIRARYPDGILWASLAEAERDASAVLALWADALALPRSSVKELLLVEDRARAVANAVGTRKMIVVIEDCEKIQDAMLFKLIGTAGVRLLSTSTPQVAHAFASPSATLELGPLSDTDARDLLASVAKIPASSEDATRILRATGCLPENILLAARMIGGAQDSGTRQRLLHLFYKEAA